MKSKQYTIFFTFLIAHFCYGQFFYTGYQEADSWLITNKNLNLSKVDSLTSWQNYRIDKNLSYSKTHHFGIFLNLHNLSSSNIIQNKSDLIGNGILTNYHFSLIGLEIKNSMFFTNKKEEAGRGRRC